MRRYAAIAALLLVLLCALSACQLQDVTSTGGSNVTVVTRFPEETGELVNPFIGNLVWASSSGDVEQPFTLVYANLTWAELEPEEGVYAFEAFEERMHFDTWREQGKHLVLRFVMDTPTDETHADIPQWLIDKTEGVYYDVEYGKGYCPDYADPVLIEEHAKVIGAIADRYRDDPFVAYVQLGSLGHWGEWHVNENIGLMPLESVRDVYAQQYVDAFEGGHALLMMRRPFNFAVEHKLGLYNDAAGKESSTNTWLDWIENGGYYDSTGEEDAISPMPDGWKYAPIGGELATSMEPEEMLSEELFDTTLSLFERSHTSWIGPGSFKDVERGGEDQQALDALMRRIGYRLRVTQSAARIGADGNVSLTLTWTNDGIAPFYFDWKTCARITDAQGETSVVTLDLDLPSLLPEQTQSVTLDLPQGTRKVEVGIVDPSTELAGVQLAMQAAHEDNWYCVLELE